jgi:hypothetical protein
MRKLYWFLQQNDDFYKGVYTYWTPTIALAVFYLSFLCVCV